VAFFIISCAVIIATALDPAQIQNAFQLRKPNFFSTILQKFSIVDRITASFKNIYPRLETHLVFLGFIDSQLTGWGPMETSRLFSGNAG
jgi:hypothetical protein